MRKFIAIVQSSKEPNKNNIWLFNDVLHYFNNGKWTRLGGASSSIPDSFYEEYINTINELENSLKVKVDKEEGKGLSTNDFTDSYKKKVDTLDQNPVTTLLSTYADRKTNYVNLTPFFFKSSYFSIYEAGGYKLGSNIPHGDFNCISLKVKAGDYFIASLTGGGVSGRAYCLYNADGEKLSFAEPNEVLNNKTITIEQDGYITFTAVNSLPYYLYGSFSFFNDFNWQYLIPIMQNISEIKDIVGRGLERKSLKVICFGNSFTNDSMGYVPAIIKNIAPELDLTLGIAYIGGCSLQQHYSNIINEEVVDRDDAHFTPKTYTLHLSTNGSGWNSTYNQSITDILAKEDWDVVTFQQSGSYSFKDFDNYIKPYILPLYSKIGEYLKKSVKYGWLLTQGAYATSDEEFREKWEGNSNNAKKLYELTGCEVFPYGTALQNLRTTRCKELGDGSYKNMCFDTGHLQEGIGCYVSALSNALKICELAGFNKVGIIGENTRVNESFITANRVPEPNIGASGVIGINENNCYLAQVAATNSIKFPFTLINMEAIENNN